MGWKCVPQVMGLVRGDGMRRDGKGQAKHRANAAAIVHEAFEIADRDDGHPIPIRKSASDTYDRSRTPNNRYTGYQTADDVVAAMEEEAAAQTVEVQTKNKETGETVIRKRPLRSDAVIGVAVIFKPPCAIARTWSREQYDKFINDSLDVMATVQCGGEVDKKTGKLKRGQEPCHLFRRENIIAGAEHWDEGSLAEGGDVYTGHWHHIYKPEDENGKYRGNLIDPYFLSRLSAVYPRMMRERGWDIEDCDCTDWEKFNDDKGPENAGYRAKRKSKIRQGGKSVNKYIASAEREAVAAQYEEAGAMLDQAAALRDDVAQRAEMDADSIREQARAEADALLTDAAEDAGNAIAQARAEAELDALAAQDTMLLEAEIEAAALVAGAESAAAKATQEQAQAEAARDKATREAEAAREKQMLAQMAIGPLEELRARIQEEAAEAERVRDKAQEDADKAKSEAEAARTEKTRLEAELADIEQDVEFNKTKLKAQADTIELHKNELTEITGQVEKSKDAWNEWFEQIKRDAADIVENAKRKAAEIVEAATGEYAFLLKWLANQKYSSGVTFLTRAREAYQKEIRERRETEMPSKVRDVGKRRPEQDGPEKA